MAYTPTTWENGDTITAEKLNNMESGIANAGVFYITATWDDSANGYVLDKTNAQIVEAYANGQLCLIDGGFHSKATVVNTPGGSFAIIEPAINVYNAANQLSLTRYQQNPETGVVSETEYLYTLTPAS